MKQLGPSASIGSDDNAHVRSRRRAAQRRGLVAVKQRIRSEGRASHVAGLVYFEYVSVTQLKTKA